MKQTADDRDREIECDLNHQIKYKLIFTFFSFFFQWIILKLKKSICQRFYTEKFGNPMEFP